MFSKITAFVSMLVALLGTLNTAEVLAIVPPKYAPWITAAATVTLALSKALVDRDRNGVPDILERQREADGQ